MFQSHLDFTEPTPKAASQELNTLLAYLRGKKNWTTAKTIASVLHMSDRKIRSLAANSDHLIISAPGTPGYKHLLDCTPDEIQEATSKLKSQGRKMWQRGQRIYTKYLNITLNK